MPSISQHTILQPLGKFLHTFSNGFLQQGNSDPLQCVLQLGNSYGHCYWKAAVVKLVETVDVVVTAVDGEAGFANCTTSRKYVTNTPII